MIYLIRIIKLIFGLPIMFILAIFWLSLFLLSVPISYVIYRDIFKLDKDEWLKKSINWYWNLFEKEKR